MSLRRYRNRVLPEVGADFPRLHDLPLLSAVVDEVESNIQAPRPLIFFGALAAIAVGVQGLFDVHKPIGQTVPMSLMLLSIANSGERKSTAENVFLGPIREFQKNKIAVHQADLKTWSVKLKIWNAQNKILVKSITKLAVKGVCTKDAERCLIDHEHNRPIRPKQFKMLYEDATSEALFSGMYQNLSSVGLMSSEGGSVLSGRALSDLSKQNAIWSGDAITVDRKTTESYELNGARVTVSIMAQESAFEEYMKKSGRKSRGSGLWSRFLVCVPRSTQGTRFLKNETISWEYRSKFSTRLTDILEKNLPLLDFHSDSRNSIKLSPEASREWLEVYNAIESKIRDGGRFHGMGDHASKLADNIARVAALLHFFEGFDGDVSFRVLRLSVDFCLWCSDEFRYVFMPPTQEELDASELGDWLRGLWENGKNWVCKNYIRQYGPNKIREKIRLEKALDKLYRSGEVVFFNKGRTQCVELLFRKLSD